jgi:MFS superfamily sulfate permease-like transporter
VILDLSAAPLVDMHGAHMLGALAQELKSEGVRVQAVEARSSVRDSLRHEGVDEKLGGVNRFTTIAEAIERELGASPGALTPKKPLRSSL